MGITINANTTPEVLYPEFWAASFDPLKVGKYNFQNLVSRDAENKLAQSGDTVNVPLTADLGDADSWTPGAAISSTAVAQEVAQVVLDKSKKKTISLNDAQLSLTPYDLIEKYGVPLAKTILKAVNLDIYLEMMKTSNFVNALSALDEDKFVDAKVILSQNEVSGDLFAVAGPDDTGHMLKLDAFQHVDVSGDPLAMRDGLIKRKFGFDIYENNIISTYTPVDLTGAVNNKGTAYAAGATTIAVDGFNDDANPVRVGDIFTLAAESGTPQHTVTAVTASSGDTISISFLPALAGSSPADDDAVVTFVASRSIMCFSADALALAARAYKPKEIGAKSSVFMFNGLPIRITVWLDSTTLNTNVQYDILYGVKLIDKNKVCRILTV